MKNSWRPFDSQSLQSEFVVVYIHAVWCNMKNVHQAYLFFITTLSGVSIVYSL